MSRSETKHASTISAPIPNRQGRASPKRRNRRGKAHTPCNAPAAKRAGNSSGPRSPSSVIAVNGLGRPSMGLRSRMDDGPAQTEVRLEKMRGAVRTLLECLGEDPDREGLIATPTRFAEALLFLTKGYQVNAETMINNALFYEGHNEMVIVRDIDICSLCEHHLLPFTGKMHIGYIPCNTVIGLSKLPRIAEMFSRRLQIQERVTREVAHAVMDILKPQGVAVVMEVPHVYGDARRREDGHNHRHQLCSRMLREQVQDAQRVHESCWREKDVMATQGVDLG